MDILYILQQSIYNKDGKWVTADSNIEIMKGILNKLVKHTDWNFHVLIGNIDDFCDIDDYKEIIDSSQVKFYSYNFPVDAFLNRQNFDVFYFDNLMTNVLPKIDIIWNNITEVSRNIKTYLYYKKYNAKLITCCYWLDCPEIGEEKVPKKVSYMWRQFDGFECSDLVVFTCDSARKAFLENSEKVFSSKYITNIFNKSVIWDFGFSREELDKFFCFEESDKPIILFLNRLSGINYTKHIEFIEAIKILHKKRNDFYVAFTNPSGKINWDWLKANVPNLLFLNDKALNRKEYIELLWKAKISVHLYELERYGGVAHREAIYCENIPITPKCNEYLRIQGNKYLFYTKVNPVDIANALDFALDNLQYIWTSFFCDIRFRNNESSFESVYKKVINDIFSLLQK